MMKPRTKRPVRRIVNPAAMRKAKASALEISKKFQVQEKPTTFKPENVTKEELAPTKFAQAHLSGTKNHDLDEKTLNNIAARLERSHAALIQRQLQTTIRQAMLDKWAPWEGTPETNERISIIPSRRRQSPLDRMFAAGKINADELAAANAILSAIQIIQSGVSIRSASLEARVDNSGSARDVLIESIGRIRLEVTYTLWRSKLPKPPGMILQMICSNQSYVAVAAAYKIGYRTARKRLLSALRSWIDLNEIARKEISRETVAGVYARLGSGIIQPPRPKPIPEPSEDE